MILGFHAADLTVLIFYLIGITILGISTVRWIRRIGDFIMPRRFGKGMLIMHAFGTGTHSDQAVSVAMLFAIVGMMYLMVNIGVMLKGSGTVITTSSGGLISANVAIVAIIVLSFVQITRG